MAKYKRQKVKRYRRSFYSRGTRIKKGIGIVVLVLAVLGAAWLAAPHVLDWATHTWYTELNRHPAQPPRPKQLHPRRYRKRLRPSRSRNSPRSWTARPLPAAAGPQWM